MLQVWLRDIDCRWVRLLSGGSTLEVRRTLGDATGRLPGRGKRRQWTSCPRPELCQPPLQSTSIVEAEWQSLLLRLQDIGFVPPDGATPRQASRTIGHDAYLTPDENEALGRVVATLSGKVAGHDMAVAVAVHPSVGRSVCETCCRAMYSSSAAVRCR